MKSSAVMQSNVNETLANLQVTPAMRAALARRISEGRRVKRKYSLAFVLTIVLVLLATSALAAFGIDLLIDFIRKNEQQYGIFEEWPTEAQHEYSLLKDELGLLVDGETFYDVPDEDDLSQTEAETIARNYVKQRGELSDEQMQQYSVQSVLFHSTYTPDNRWYVRFVQEFDGIDYGQFGVLLLPDGTVETYIVNDNGIMTPDTEPSIIALDIWAADRGPMAAWSVEDLLHYSNLYENGDYRMETETDMPRDEALSLAQQTVAQEAWLDIEAVRSYLIQGIIQDAPYLSGAQWIVWITNPEELEPNGELVTYTVFIDNATHQVTKVTLPGGNG